MNTDDSMELGIKFRFHHVGCAVKNMQFALDYYVNVLGYRLTIAPYEVPSQKVKVCFLSLGDGGLLELVEGLEENSPVKKILEMPGGGVYHVCYAVDSLDSAIAYLKNHGFLLMTRYEKLDNPEFRYVFFLNPDHQIFELCEILPKK